MEDRIKDTIVLVLMSLVVLFLIWAINSSIKAGNSRKYYQQEASRRMDLERTMATLSQENSSLEAQASVLEKELNMLKDTNASLTKELNQEQLVTKTLKEELEKLDRLKTALEKDLKEALVNCPSK